jgi:replicative DNA helicase
MQEKERKPSKEEILREYAGEDKIISSHEMEVILKSQESGFINLKSKIPSLDEATEGFRDGELIVISGPTKNGKTLLAQTLTVNFIKQQEFPLWFSFEVPPRQFLEQFPELLLFYMSARLKAHDLQWVEDRILESFLKNRTRVIFIDHLHFLFDIARTKSPSIEIGTVVRRLKTLAVQGGFVVFLLCHTRKGSSEEDPSYESIRDSSFISQEADCVLMIRRCPKVGPNAAKLSVEFHRRTGVFQIMIDVFKVNGLLQEREPREERLMRKDWE